MNPKKIAWFWGLWLVFPLLVLPAGSLSAAEILLKGRVMAKGQGLAGATVRLLLALDRQSGDFCAGDFAPTTLERTSSDRRGYFELKAKDVGFYRLVLEAEGYVGVVQEMALFSPSSASLPPIELKPARFVQLTVLGSRGEILQGARIRHFFQDVGHRDHQHPAPWPETTKTDSDGRATLSVPVGIGSFALIAAPGWPAMEADLPAGVINTEYQVKLEDGQEVFLQTLDGQRRPLPQVTIAALLAGGRVLMQIGCSGEDGQARVKVLPSQQELYFFDAAQRATVEPVPEKKAIPDQEEPRPKQVFLSERVVVSSRVIEVPGGEPVPDAWVYVPGRGPLFGRSDRQGRFELSLPPFYTGALHTYKAGYSEAKIGSQDLETRAIPLWRALRLEGLVLGPGGSALEGAVVRTSNAEERWQLETTTGPDGRFVFHEVAEYPSCEIVAHFEGRQSAAFSFDPRKQEGTPIRLEIPPATSMALRVVDEQDRPIAGAEIFAQLADSQLQLSLYNKNRWRNFPGLIGLGLSDAEGRVRSDRLKAGFYQLGVLAPGFAPKVQNSFRVGPPAGLSAAAEEAKAEEILVLQSAAATRGVVVDETGKAVEGAAIALLWPSPDRGVNRKDPPLALSDARGEFLVREWAAGQRALLRADKKGYVAAVLPEIEIGSDQRWVLQLKKAGSLRGRISTGEKKMLEGWVSLSPKEYPLSSDTRSVFTDEDGSFVLEGLTPGPHDLTVRGVPGYQVYQGGPVEIVAGRQLEMEIELKKAAVVFGRVIRPDGKPAHGARVQVYPNQDSSFSPYFAVEVDALGQYRIEDAAPGSVIVEVQTGSPARRSLTRKAIFVEGLNELDFVIEHPVLSISGQLQGPRGEAIAGAVLRLQPGHQKTTSRADGSVVLDDLDPGIHEVTITKEGYVFPPERLLLREEGPHQGFLWRLQEATLVVEGELLGLSPGELSQVEVYASSLEGSGGHRPGMVSRGRFRIEKLAPGTWSLVAQLRGRLVTREIKLTEGDALSEEGLDFGSLGGFIAQVVEEGRPVRDVFYHFSFAATYVAIDSGHSADGRVELWAPPGTYRLMLRLGDRTKRIAFEIANGQPTEQVIDLATP